MKLTLSSLSICRTPIFSVNTTLENVWEQLKGYIEESSPSFYHIIKDCKFNEYETLSIKTKFTIWKYFNRVRFRPTPYGNFASFCIVPVMQKNATDNIIHTKTAVLHSFANWQEKENINFDPKWLTHHSSFFIANSSIYECLDDLRYINNNEGSFELSAVVNDETACMLLSFCKQKRNLAEIQQLMFPFHLNKAMVNYLVEQLISLQLLLTDYQPNIVGKDYFQRIGHQSISSKNDYTIAERECLQGHLNEKDLKVLLEATEFMNRNGIPNHNQALESFKEKFTTKFENKEISLCKAMDPEMGIGYLSLIQNKNDDPLIQELKSLTTSAADLHRQINYSPLHQYILNQYMDQHTVFLEKMPSSTLAPKKAIANTSSIMFRPADELLVVEQMGGCTANSLLGRFSMASEQVTQMGRHFAAVEQQANPGVAFFDIAYQMEKNADNINRRKSLYPYELPILCWSETENVLNMDDIMVSVKNGEIILRSLSTGKRLVPRLASAYNYTRSDLAVYRFLSDLQHQKLHSGLGIDILQLFPGLSHYQRIQYKNVVLSAEKWKIPEQFYAGFESLKSTLALKKWLSNIKLNRPFKCGYSDQTLLFNPSLEEDLIAFLLFCKHKKDLYIEEAILPSSALLRDEEQQPYLSEFIINLEHLSQLYQPCEAQEPVDKQGLKEVFLPGNEWLYFEIYCHQSRSNYVLQEIGTFILPRLKGKVENWFYIRYSDPADHIRFRVKLKDQNDSGTILHIVNQVIAPLIDSGLVSDFQIKPYRPELERYGYSRIILAEKCFNVSSKLAIHLISRHEDANELYAITMMLIQNVWFKTGLSGDQQLLFADKMAAYFSAEMNMGPEGFKIINRHYKAFDTLVSQLHISKLTLEKMKAFEKYYTRCLALCNAKEQEKMTSDLLHMHINRLFSADQRLHEYLFYYYLGRKLKIRMSLTKKEGSVII
jgi:thiopeptide-type bacteriocin biosynthesis protein